MRVPSSKIHNHYANIRGLKIPPIPRCIWHSTPAIKSNNGQHNGLRKELEASFKGSSLPWDWYIYLHFNHTYQPNVGEYSLHGSCGLFLSLWIEPSFWATWKTKEKIQIQISVSTFSIFCLALKLSFMEQIVPNVRIEFRIDMVPGSPTTIFYRLVYQPPIFYISRDLSSSKMKHNLVKRSRSFWFRLFACSRGI